MSDSSPSAPAQPWGAPRPQIVLPGATPEAMAAVPPAPDHGQPVDFSSEGGEFLKKLIRGGLLELATFGFYRFWLATDIRRHLWSHTHVDGEGAEYTGTGRELLIGFLFALAILVPVYLVYFLIGVEAERVQAFASIPLGLFLLLFSQFAIYRARRYRLTRTVWRGVRFWMTGSAWKYAFMSFGWMIAVVLTLGLLYPWRAAALENFKMQHTRYGDLNGGFDASPAEFLRKGIWLWLCVMGPIVVIAGVLLATWGEPGGGGGVLIGLSVFALFVSPFLYPFFKALEWRWWASGVHFGGARMTSSLEGLSLLGLFLKYYVIMAIITSIAAMVVVAIGGGLLAAFGVTFKGAGATDVADLMKQNLYPVIAVFAIGYLMIAMVAGVIQRYFMQHEYWALIAGSLQIKGLENLKDIAGKGELAGSLGEGLADGLDVGGF